MCGSGHRLLRDLGAEIAAGRFREDLFHRLNVVPLRVPGLAERREDIPELIAYYIDRLQRGFRSAKRTWRRDAYATLQVQARPGNVCQLRNVVERILDPCLRRSWPTHFGRDAPFRHHHRADRQWPGHRADRLLWRAAPARELFFERDYLNAQIMRFGGNISRTAAFIGMERSPLHRKPGSLGIGAARRSLEVEISS